jgi:hypothetical protein
MQLESGLGHRQTRDGDRYRAIAFAIEEPPDVM